MKIAFYLAKYGNTYDKLISFTTGSPYSHCELVFSDGMCGSSSPRDGGVRLKYLNLDDHWVVYDLEYPFNESQIRYWFKLNEGMKYDWVGAVASVLHIDLSEDNKRYCSQICAEMLGLESTVTPSGLLKDLNHHNYIKY